MLSYWRCPLCFIMTTSEQLPPPVGTPQLPAASLTSWLTQLEFTVSHVLGWKDRWGCWGAREALETEQSKYVNLEHLKKKITDWALNIHDHKMSGEIMDCIFILFILLLNNDTMQSAKSFTWNSTFQPLRPLLYKKTQHPFLYVRNPFSKPKRGATQTQNVIKAK